METQLLIKALCSYRKRKRDSLKNALKYGRDDIANSRIDQIMDIDEMIDKLEDQLIIENLN